MAILPKVKSALPHEITLRSLDLPKQRFPLFLSLEELIMWNFGHLLFRELL